MFAPIITSLFLFKFFMTSSNPLLLNPNLLMRDLSFTSLKILFLGLPGWGLRDFHDKDLLEPLLRNLLNANNSMLKPKPMLLKISPDIDNNQLDIIIELVMDLKIDGLIATNTTISRDGLISKNKNETGGLSGLHLKNKSNKIISYLRKKLGKNFPIIGVGGIMSAEDAIEKFESGADLIQLYTGFIYEGPGLIKKINKLLLSDNK